MIRVRQHIQAINRGCTSAHVVWSWIVLTQSFFLQKTCGVVTDDSGFRERTRAATDTRRFLFTEGRPAFAAKNRFGMPEKIPIPLNFDFSTIAQYWAYPEESR